MSGTERPKIILRDLSDANVSVSEDHLMIVQTVTLAFQLMTRELSSELALSILCIVVLTEVMQFENPQAALDEVNKSVVRALANKQRQEN